MNFLSLAEAAYKISTGVGRADDQLPGIWKARKWKELTDQVLSIYGVNEQSPALEKVMTLDSVIKIIMGKIEKCSDQLTNTKYKAFIEALNQAKSDDGTNSSQTASQSASTVTSAKSTASTADTQFWCTIC